MSFHKWCSALLTQHNITVPRNPTQLPTKLINEIKKGHIQLDKYDAILVDEGHDFKDKPEWLQLILSLRKSKNSLFVLAYDEAQALYGKGKKAAFNLDILGCGDKLHKHILRKNYRNSEQILLFAKVLANAFLIDAEHEDIPRVRPIGCGKSSQLPRLWSCTSFEDELEKISEEIKTARYKGRNWSDIAVLFHTYDFEKLEDFSEKISQVLRQNGIPCSKNEREFSCNVVKVMSFTKAKGLGFGMVNLVGISQTEFSDSMREHDMGHRREHLAEDIRYLYNAITRALEDLVITYTKPKEDTLSHKRLLHMMTALNRVRRN